MNIVMPMAGRGSRFAQVGIATPKPLIDVRGKPMYAWATEGLPLALARRLIFICLAEHLADAALERDIKSRYAQYDPAIIALDQVTEGQACTVLAARELIDNDEPLLIFNADTYCPTTLGQALDGDRARRSTACWTCFAPRATSGASPASTSGIACWKRPRNGAFPTGRRPGLYYFRRGGDFVRHADAMIAANERSNNEFYVAPVYNRLIAAGADIRANPVERRVGAGHARGPGPFRTGVSAHRREHDAVPKKVLHVLNSAGGGAALSTLALDRCAGGRGNRVVRGVPRRRHARRAPSAATTPFAATCCLLGSIGGTAKSACRSGSGRWSKPSRSWPPAGRWARPPGWPNSPSAGRPT